MKVIDATGLILGRMASVVAKLALLGEDVSVVNCENAVISGKPKVVLKKFKAREARGDALKGPYTPKMPDRIVKRAIKGMLPFRRASEGSRGRQALGRIKCYISVPEELKAQKTETIEAALSDRLKVKYITISELSKLLKGR